MLKSPQASGPVFKNFLNACLPIATQCVGKFHVSFSLTNARSAGTFHFHSQKKSPHQFGVLLFFNFPSQKLYVLQLREGSKRWEEILIHFFCKFLIWGWRPITHLNGFSVDTVEKKRFFSSIILYCHHSSYQMCYKY